MFSMYSVRASLRLLVLGLGIATGVPMLLGGCTPTLQWVKPGAEPGSSDQQQASCALQAETSYMSSEESVEARTSRIARWTSLCMRASGFRQQEVAP